jgi:dihydroflavonol-4-reductase
VVKGHIAAAERGRIGERYILCGENLTHKEIFTRTAQHVGVHPPIAELPIPLLRFAASAIEHGSKLLGIEPIVTRDLISGAGKRNWYSCEKARRELDYAITLFDETIRATYTWYVEQGLLRQRRRVV